MTKIETMKLEIAKLTGRQPASLDETYLSRRLASLKQRKVAGKKAVDRYNDSTTVLSVSMPGAAKDATIRIAGGEQVGVSELVRRAVAEYAQKRGYADEISHFEVE